MPATVPAARPTSLTAALLDADGRRAAKAVSVGGTQYAVDASGVNANVERVRTSTKKDDAKKVAAGAIIGAIAGQVIGKDTKGTVIGAATGAAAGGAAAAATGDYDGCINDGARITFKLDQPLQVKASA